MALFKEACQFKSANKFLCLWANKKAYVSELVRPVLDDAWSHSALSFVGFSTAVPFIDVPDVAGSGLIDGTEDAQLLMLHFRLFLAHLGQLILFSMQHLSPPWSWVRYLENAPNSRKIVLARMKEFWSMVLALESSVERVHVGYAKQLHVLVRLLTKWVWLPRWLGARTPAL